MAAKHNVWYRKGGKWWIIRASLGLDCFYHWKRIEFDPKAEYSLGIGLASYAPVNVRTGKRIVMKELSRIIPPEFLEQIKFRQGFVEKWKTKTIEGYYKPDKEKRK